MNYSETLDYLYNSTPVFHLQGGSAYKPGLDNTNRLLEALGNPHRTFKSIHIAGTNGKGSTSHMITAVLQEAGYRTGLYTSPHLVDFGERIRINGTMIEQQYVIDFVENHRSLLEEIRPSFFEITMCLAFAYFASQNIDIAIIEVGLGGRLDSTNVISPEVCVITNIGLDHTDFLGTTLPEIASEKAGIIKSFTPVVIGETHPDTAPIFIEKAHEMNAPILFADQVEVDALPQSDLQGIYQTKNRQTAHIAIQELIKLDYNISPDHIASGFAHTCALTGLRGRWEILQHNPKVICDTGHNSHGIHMIAKQLASLSCNTLRIVIGFVKDKDIDHILAMLPTDATYYFTQASTPRAMNANELRIWAANYKLKGTYYSKVTDAYHSALTESHPDDVIFVGGSNFVVGEFLQDL